MRVKIKALVSFAGPLSMVRGEISEAADEKLAASLISCGYAENAEEAVLNEAKRSNSRKREKSAED